MNLPPAPGHGPDRAAASATRALASAVLASLVAACQTTPAAHSGYLSSYSGLGDRDKPQRAKAKRRDDALSASIARIYIEPSVLKVEAETPLRPEERAMVRFEIDRQLCFKLSRRFELAPAPAPDAGTVRTAIVRIEPTNRASSAVSAAAGFFSPVPIVKFRAPMTTGGLAAESELLAPDGRQAAAIAWSKRIEVVSNTDPSLSPVGDALQLAKPYGDAVRKAFTVKPAKGEKAAKKRKVPNPDPCARFGPRREAGRFVGNLLVGAATGLYFPSVAGAGRPAEPTPPAAPPGPASSR